MQKPRQRIDNRGIPRKPEGRGGGGVAVAEVDREEEEQIERKRRYIGPTVSPPPSLPAAAVAAAREGGGGGGGENKKWTSPIAWPGRGRGKGFLAELRLKTLLLPLLLRFYFLWKVGGGQLGPGKRWPRRDLSH